MINLWLQWADDHAERNPSPYDLKCVKEFMTDIAFAIDPIEELVTGEKIPAENTILVYWRQFTAGWYRQDDAIPKDITLSMRNFIIFDLPKLIGVAKSKRARRFGTKNHFVHLGRQLWENDWVEYQSPATRVYDWAQFLAMVCSSSRIGEYIESSCRAGSDRGMYYKFAVFRNEHGNKEFAIQLVRDAKNLTHTPGKRPEHTLYEGLGPMPLLCNPMIPILAILVANKAFRDYHSLEDLLAIEPLDDEMIHPNAFSNRLRALGVRAGYPRPPTIHDFRAEGLFWINQFYDAATRMKYASHINPDTYGQFYQPNNSGADGQGSCFGSELRSIVSDLFRGLTVERNPQLVQALPAQQYEALRATPKFVELEEELATPLKLNGPDASRRRKLHAERRQLIEKELRKWQHLQPYRQRVAGHSDPPPCYHRNIFSRIRFLMPERDRLASDLSRVDTLRSPAGLRAIRDMITLCEANAEVVLRPGLEPDMCLCTDLTTHQQIASCSPTAVDTGSSYDSRHIYHCVKKSHGFAELCFLCSEWVFCEDQWSDHCRHHLNQPGMLPAHCDPLIYSGVLATAGYCVFCMGDPSLAPEVRLRQFLDRGSWKDHTYAHYTNYVRSLDARPIVCPHPRRCDAIFDSVQSFKFHLLDDHCPDFVKEPHSLLEQDGDVKSATIGRKRAQYVEAVNAGDAGPKYEFMDETAAVALRHASTIDSCAHLALSIPNDSLPKGIDVGNRRSTDIDYSWPCSPEYPGPAHSSHLPTIQCHRQYPLPSLKPQQPQCITIKIFLIEILVCLACTQCTDADGFVN
ncbi:hypothetical protein B0T17DRAFT_276620 [Bombardia bombarda]|uniref:Uncharacterized protein n=1 Tax=Bombardia bombarda TaxID=252184 RepID=A0AA39WT72_9PEZI|nr:hypothetical protein B0T17DRAFT_276620 [Bombardia bombarda]